MVDLAILRKAWTTGKTYDILSTERVSMDFAMLQLAIVLSQLIATLKGATLNDVQSIYEASKSIVDLYHGKNILGIYILNASSFIYLSQLGT